MTEASVYTAHANGTGRKLLYSTSVEFFNYNCQGADKHAFRIETIKPRVLEGK